MTGSSCAMFADRIRAITDGVVPGDDPALADHLGTCLSCYRVVADVKAAASLVQRLRVDAAEDTAGGAADPGAVFWAGFAGRVWDAARAEGVVPAAVGSAGHSGRDVTKRSEAPIAGEPRPGIRAVAGVRLRWWAVPAVAAALVLLMLNLKTPGTSGTSGTSGTIGSLATSSGSPDASPVAAIESDDSLLAPATLSDLDADGLRAVLGRMAAADAEIEDFVDDLADETIAQPALVRVQALDGSTLAALSVSLAEEPF